MCSLNYTLLGLQQSFEQPNTQPLQGLSIHDTIRMLLSRGNKEAAQNVGRQMKISDRSMWHLIVSQYSKERKWDTLEEYVDENCPKRRAPPIGYLPIIEAFIEGNENNRAKKIYFFVVIRFCREIGMAMSIKILG